MNRRAASTKYGNKTDPRYGTPYGGDEARVGWDLFPQKFPVTMYTPIIFIICFYVRCSSALVCIGRRLHRAFTELGEVCATIGKSADRPDIAAHGNELLQMAPLLYTDLHTSLNRTLIKQPSPRRQASGAGSRP